jgi:hypothetical protein
MKINGILKMRSLVLNRYSDIESLREKWKTEEKRILLSELEPKFRTHVICVIYSISATKIIKVHVDASKKTKVRKKVNY